MKVAENKSKIEELDGGIVFTKNVNGLLVKRIDELESQLDQNECLAINNGQYSRRETIEIHGIPDNVPDAEIEGKVIGLLSEIGVNVNAEDFHAVHHKGKKRKNKGRTIIAKFISIKIKHLAIVNRK